MIIIINYLNNLKSLQRKINAFTEMEKLFIKCEKYNKLLIMS